MKQNREGLLSEGDNSGAAGDTLANQRANMRSQPKYRSRFMIGGAVLIAYTFLGEFLLPEPLRLSSFIGTRIGHVKALATRGAAPDQARANCLMQREQVALKAFNECLAQPYATMPKCEFARDQAKNFPCD
ncbi:hypothetical protein [Zhengella mangrovi]|uniref:hypothetical protein n=1 Tax=Zhengella mangrovi TaxID=1982044 RepID=UPI0010547219|nr:hypothetical protein [Zhengella mangrovi]